MCIDQMLNDRSGIGLVGHYNYECDYLPFVMKKSSRLQITTMAKIPMSMVVYIQD